MGQHDRRYKKVFANPVFIKKLLLSFVKEKFVHRLDFSKMERLDKDFVIDNFTERESDIVYKIKFQNKEIFVFILMEFQSTINKKMVFRFFNYITSLYLCYQNTFDKEKSPAIFPILLYSGDKEWKIPIKIEDMIEKTIPKEYIPHFKYYPILINNYVKEQLNKIHNVISAMFYIENSSPEELENEIDILLDIIREENKDEINIFIDWFNEYLSYLDGDTEKNTQLKEQFENLLEVKTMFATKLKEHDDRLREEVSKRVSEEVSRKVREEERRYTASSMKKRNIDIHTIAEITGLSENEIEGL